MVHGHAALCYATVPERYRKIWRGYYVQGRRILVYSINAAAEYASVLTADFYPRRIDRYLYALSRLYPYYRPEVRDHGSKARPAMYLPLDLDGERDRPGAAVDPDGERHLGRGAVDADRGGRDPGEGRVLSEALQGTRRQCLG